MNSKSLNLTKSLKELLELKPVAQSNDSQRVKKNNLLHRTEFLITKYAKYEPQVSSVADDVITLLETYKFPPNLPSRTKLKLALLASLGHQFKFNLEEGMLQSKKPIK